MKHFILPLLTVTAFALLASFEIPSGISKNSSELSCSCKKKRHNASKDSES